MVHTDRSYKDGMIGLYTIDAFLYSVILDFLPGHHEALQRELGLENTEVIDDPFNKYLERLGRLKVIAVG